MFGVDYSKDHVEATDLVGFDLCVLAQADHSIHTYGTFGLWGSLLAGGDVVVSKGRNMETVTEEDEIYMKSSMPNWLYVDTRDISNITVLKLDQSNQFIIADDDIS